MGTRSLTIVRDGDFLDEVNKELLAKGKKAKGPEELVVLYRQFDGYPSVHGKELKEFLEKFNMVNGLSVGKEPVKIANGAHCLAALLVSHFKGDTPGGFYLHKAGTRDCGEEYTYTVTTQGAGEPLLLEVRSGYARKMTVIYSGTLKDFNPEAVEG